MKQSILYNIPQNIMIVKIFTNFGILSEIRLYHWCTLKKYDSYLCTFKKDLAIVLQKCDAPPIFQYSSIIYLPSISTLLK